MKTITLMILIALTAVQAFACEEWNKVYPQLSDSTTISAVYVCSNSGEPSISKRHWICRTDLSEGDDIVVSYVPLCPGAKSEYDQLIEKKNSGHGINIEMKKNCPNGWVIGDRPTCYK